MSGARRGLAITAIVLGIVVAVLAMASAVPTQMTSMPESLWVAGLDTQSDDEKARFRIGAADGVELTDARVASCWGHANKSPSGVSVRVRLDAWGRTKVRLAHWGIVPLAEVKAAGYDATGATKRIDDVEWREFRKFDEGFSRQSIGWWNYLR